MITPEEFLESELTNRVGFHNPTFVALCDATANQVKELQDVNTILDFGGGVGVYSQSFQNAGYDTTYFDIFKPHNEYVKKNEPKFKISSKPITTDLMAFIEVAEHMTDLELSKLFKEINPKYIMFSSTSNRTDRDELWGHINIKEQNEWVEFWKEKGYELIKNLSYPTNYTKLFKKI